MEIARREKRPFGIYIAALLKVIGAVMLIIVLIALFLPYLKEFLIKEDYKFISEYVNFVDKVVSNSIVQAKKDSFAAIALFFTVQLLISAEGIISRRRWIWGIELLMSACFTILFLLIILGNIINPEIVTTAVPREVYIFIILALVCSMLYLFYLMKKSIRDYFGIFKRKLK